MDIFLLILILYIDTDTGFAENTGLSLLKFVFTCIITSHLAESQSCTVLCICFSVCIRGLTVLMVNSMTQFIQFLFCFRFYFLGVGVFKTWMTCTMCPRTPHSTVNLHWVPVLYLLLDLCVITPSVYTHTQCPPLLIKTSHLLWKSYKNDA